MAKKRIFSAAINKRLVGNFLSLSVLRGFQFLLPLITFPYLIRTIGLEKFGLLNFALSLCLYFGSVIQFGFGSVVTREIARNRNNRVDLSKIYSVTLGASVLLVLVSSLVFFVLVSFVDRFNLYVNLYLFSFIFVALQSLFPTWFFQGMERMKYVAFFGFLSSGLYLAGIYIFVKSGDDLLKAPLINAIAALIAFLLSLIIIRRRFGIVFSLPQMGEVFNLLRSSCNSFVSQFAPNMYNNSAVFIMGFFLNNITVGFYSAAIKVIDVALSFGYVLLGTFFPYLSRDFTKFKIFQSIMLSFGGVLAAMTFIFANFIVSFLLGAGGEQVANYVRWLSVTVFFGFCYLLYNSGYLMISGREKAARNISLLVSLISFCTLIIFVYFFGVVGAVLSIMLARAGGAAVSFLYYWGAER